MTTKTKKVDMSAPAAGHMVRWTQSEFTALDVLDIQRSLSRPASWVEISLGAGASCTVLVNAVYHRSPPYKKAADVHVSAPDLSVDVEVIDSNALSFTLTSGEVLVINDRPVANLYFSALSGDITVTAS